MRFLLPLALSLALFCATSSVLAQIVHPASNADDPAVVAALDESANNCPWSAFTLCAVRALDNLILSPFRVIARLASPYVNDYLSNASNDAFDWGSGLMLQLVRPEACFMCTLVLGVVRFIHIAGSAAFSVITAPVLIVMVAAFLLNQTFTISRHFLSAGRIPWATTIAPFIWFTVALLLMGALHQGAATGIFADLFHGLLAPFLTLSLSAGQIVLDSMALSFVTAQDPSSTFSGFTVSRDILADDHMRLSQSNFGAVDPSSSQYEMLSGLTRALMSIHMICILGMSRGLLYLTNLTGLVSLTGWLSVVIGVVLFVAFLVFFLVAQARVIDPLVRLAVVLSFSPLILATLPFPGLRATTLRPVLRALGYCGAYFLLLGIIYGLVVYFMLQSFTYSVDLPQIDPAKLFTTFVSREASLGDAHPGFNSLQTVTISGTTYTTLKISGPLLILVSLLLCYGLVEAMTVFAAGLASYDLQRDVGQVASQQIESVGLVVGAVLLRGATGGARMARSHGPRAASAAAGAVRRFRAG